MSPTAAWVLTLAAVGAALALAVAVVAIIVAGGGSNDGGAALGAAGVTETQTVEVELGEFYVEPASIEVPAGTELRVTITNAGELAHDLKLEGTTGSELVDPGETVTADLGVIEASGQAWCTVPGHKEAGMVLDITVTGAATGAGDPAAAAAEPARPADVDEISRHPTELPTTSDYRLYRDGRYQNIAKRQGPLTQEVHVQIREVVAEVLDGTTMELWTFDGAIPGPMLRARVGDSIDFFLHNPEGSTMPHNIDFHAVTGPGGGSVRLDTAPGSVSNLQVKLLRPGIYIYHCAFPDIPTHIAHGMYGLIVVEPEGGLPPADHEYYVMQSELYTDRGGDLGYTELADAGHLAFSGELGNREEPTFVVFNGRPEAISGDRALGASGDDPILSGDTVRMFVGNIGPNLISSFHLIGEIFDRVYVEGSFGLVNGDVQTTLAPSGGAVGVELTVEVPGEYLLVDHSIFRVHKGALGVLTVTGPDNPAVYEPKGYSDELR